MPGVPPRSEVELQKEFLLVLWRAAREKVRKLVPPKDDNDPTVRDQLELIKLKNETLKRNIEAADKGLLYLRGKAHGAKGESLELQEELDQIKQRGEPRLDDDLDAITAKLEGHKDAVAKEALRQPPDKTPDGEEED